MKYLIKVINQCIRVEPYGVWDADTVLEFQADLKKQINLIKDKEWASLVITTNWVVGTPETEALMDEFQKWCVENNQKFEAVVVDDDGLKKYQSDRFLREIKLSPIKLQFFNNEDQAIAWLKGFGFF